MPLESGFPLKRPGQDNPVINYLLMTVSSSGAREPVSLSDKV